LAIWGKFDVGQNQETGVNAMRLEISLNGAEADALKQILARHIRALDKFEKNQLVNVARKVVVAREDARYRGREAWLRFVWTEDDITILRHGRGSPDRQAVSDGCCSCECHAGGMTPRSAPGRTWCAECLADRAGLADSTIIGGA
jgi:hypothetical protein